MVGLVIESNVIIEQSRGSEEGCRVPVRKIAYIEEVWGVSSSRRLEQRLASSDERKSVRWNGMRHGTSRDEKWELIVPGRRESGVENHADELGLKIMLLRELARLRDPPVFPSRRRWSGYYSDDKKLWGEGGGSSQALKCGWIDDSVHNSPSTSVSWSLLSFIQRITAILKLNNRERDES